MTNRSIGVLASGVSLLTPAVAFPLPARAQTGEVGRAGNFRISIFRYSAPES